MKAKRTTALMVAALMALAGLVLTGLVGDTPVGASQARGPAKGKVVDSLMIQSFSTASDVISDGIYL